MNGLDLFAGSSMFSVALKRIIPGYRTLCYVEKAPYRQAILISRIKDGHLDDASIWDDIQTFDPNPFTGMVDIITAGFPCQPYSVAGKNKGEADRRNLWPDTFRCILGIRPRYVLLENVPNLLNHEYARKIYSDLARFGYDKEWDVVPAAFSGASHLRKRLWILGNPKINAPGELPERTEAQKPGPLGDGRDVADSQRPRKQQSKRSQREKRRRIENGGIPVIPPGPHEIEAWRRILELDPSLEPAICRMADGLAFRLERLETIGDGIVPQVVRDILQVDEL